jgi:hypothetical protein
VRVRARGVTPVSLSGHDATDDGATSGRSAPSTRQRETLTERVGIEPQPHAEPGAGVKEQENASKLHGSSRERDMTDAEELESSSKVAVFGVRLPVRDATDGAATSGRSAPSTRQRETLTERLATNHSLTRSRGLG